MDMGSCVPGISNLKALPSPSPNLWPQFLFDLDYSGEQCNNIHKSSASAMAL